MCPASGPYAQSRRAQSRVDLDNSCLGTGACNSLVCLSACQVDSSGGWRGLLGPLKGLRSVLREDGARWGGAFLPTHAPLACEVLHVPQGALERLKVR